MVRGVQAASTRAGEGLTGTPLDNDGVHARQRQLARQHQTRRTSSGNHHRVLGHRHRPIDMKRRSDHTRTEIDHRLD